MAPPLSSRELEARRVAISDSAAADPSVLVPTLGFEGPLGLLLSLVESRRLDVLTVPLGELAAAYLDALASLPADRARHLSSFVAVASQLILIKSRALLPAPPAPTAGTGDEEVRDPEEDLRRRLVLYRLFRDAAGRLGARSAASVRLFHREAPLPASSIEVEARPGPRWAPEALATALRRLAVVAVPPAPPPDVVPRTVTLAERAELIRASLARAPRVVLQDLLAGTTDRVVMAVTFLAMLELVKRRELVVEQSEPWGPITCRPASTGAPG